jgi:low temperature requirement protein LtrA
MRSCWSIWRWGGRRTRPRDAGQGVPSAGWLILGGTALFIAGHAAFKVAVWRVVSWQRVAAVVVLGLLGLAARSLPALALALCAAAVVVGVAVADHWVPAARA